MDPAIKTSKLAYEVIGEVSKLTPKQGDVIIIEHMLPLATGDRGKVQQQFQSLFPNSKVVVMQAGMKVKVVNDSETNS